MFIQPSSFSYISLSRSLRPLLRLCHIFSLCLFQSIFSVVIAHSGCWILFDVIVFFFTFRYAESIHIVSSFFFSISKQEKIGSNEIILNDIRYFMSSVLFSGQPLKEGRRKRNPTSVLEMNSDEWMIVVWSPCPLLAIPGHDTCYYSIACECRPRASVIPSHSKWLRGNVFR